MEEKDQQRKKNVTTFYQFLELPWAPLAAKNRTFSSNVPINEHKLFETEWVNIEKKIEMVVP